MKKFLTIGTLFICMVLLVAGCGGKKNQWLDYLRIMPEDETTLAGVIIQTSAYADLLDGYYADIIEEPLLPVEQLAFNNSLLFNLQEYADAEWMNTLGFTVDDVTGLIAASAGPIDGYQAVRGTFTADDIEYAAKNGPLQEHLEVKSYAGYEYYSWGRDRDIRVNSDWQSNVRLFGWGYRLAYVDGFALWMVWTDELQSMIDAYAGNIPSLADKEDYRLLADELEDLNTVTALFSSDTLSLSEYIERTRERMNDVDGSGFEKVYTLDNDTLLKPFSSFATGAGEDENGRYMVIVILNPDESTAELNVSRLEQRINESEMYPSSTDRDMRNIKWTDDGVITSMDITSRGRFIVAKLYGDGFTRWKSLQYYGTSELYIPLLLHE